MTKLTRRNFLSISTTGIGGLMIGSHLHSSFRGADSSSPIETFYRMFQDPDRSYSIRPFWFWNGDLKGEEIARQIREMVDHGVYGAYVHNRDGLQTPYLSEEWWKVMGESLKAAKEAGFSLCMVDEFEWPSGEVRDYWMPGINKSRVIAANPDFHIRRLHPSETTVKGPRTVQIPLPESVAAVVAGRRLWSDRLDGASLRKLSWADAAKEVSWEVPEGEWTAFTYKLEGAIGQPDHGSVDLMSREAVAKYIELYYEELNRRFGEYLGNAMPATFADHEGNYGSKLPWTPVLFEAFERRTGYDLTPYLPALTYDIGPRTEKVRCDLLDTVSQLYSDNFFQQVTDWCEKHHIEHSGHVWEESLFFGPMAQGDFFQILRSLSNPGCDTLLEWARQSVWLKEVASVAEFEGKRMVCENQGVQGTDSYISPEGMKRVSNCLGAWNVGEFIPHAFNYDLSRINFPPDWFRSQPYQPWFRAYADLMRRISFVNVQAQLVADILLYYPQVSMNGQSAPVFRTEDFSLLATSAPWNDDAVETNSQYSELKLRLSENCLDYMVADDYYLTKGQVEGKQLRIAKASFGILILPPISTIRLKTAERARDFFQSGGTVIALRRLATVSVENGRGDPALKAIWDDVFDSRDTLQPFQLRENAAGGRAYFLPGSVPDLVRLLRQIYEPDVEIIEGPRGQVYAAHKKYKGYDWYWVVNDTAQSRTNFLRFRVVGRPERWDAQTGQRASLFYRNEGGSTLVRLTLNPWDAAYVVFDPHGPTQGLELDSTNLDDLFVISSEDDVVRVQGRAIAKEAPLFVSFKGGTKQYRGEYKAKSTSPLEITGEWKVSVEGASIQLPHALVMDDPDDRGLRERWFGDSDSRRGWETLWLSPMNRSIRRWNIVGPFPNPDDRALEESFPPEKTVDYQAVYIGDENQELRWLKLSSAEATTGPMAGAWNLGTVVVEGGPYGPYAHIVNYGKPLRLSPCRGTIFAQTNIYNPKECEAVIILASPSPSAVFLGGEKVYSRWLRPLYNELTDGFAARIPIHLRQGWTSLLLKFLHNQANPTGGHFTCRIDNPDGSAISGLFASARILAKPEWGIPGGYRWLRFAIPAVAKSLIVPNLRNPWLAFVDKNQVASSSEIAFPPGAKMVTLRVSSDEDLDHPFAFSTKTASVPLGTWKVPGLENFSGRVVYEKTVDVPPSLLAERILLDCGEVGVCAEAWVNGKTAGSRAWGPYVFDVTGRLRPGKNQLKVRVANTEGNARAVGPNRDNLRNIDVDGWVGPARLVPFVETEIRCQRV